MDSRREFLKKAALISGAAGVAGMLPPSIQRAFAINPEVGTTFLDAEHVVILMQENRSFDHCYGSLQGVRGFNDPRAMTLPNGNAVWLQTNDKGETYAPFRLNIKETKSTWMGSLPHSWSNQVDARNGGRHDRWLDVKRSGHEEYKNMPLTMGFHNREDLPFYYSLADAFTVCDQNFCSTLTGTTANRLYLWTGKIREDPNAPARVRNEETDYDSGAAWKTFPERLEENKISWKIYQNELSEAVGFKGEEDAWLGNFGDNPIEYFEQFHVGFLKSQMSFLPEKVEALQKAIQDGETGLQTLASGTDAFIGLSWQLENVKKALALSLKNQEYYTAANYEALSPQAKSIHEKAFTTNVNDPHYRALSSLKYKDGDMDREMKVPMSDVLFQFRKDVKEGKLPAVSWLVAPENFSDHPGAPWYGAWYLSETLDILTQNPDVWKKTIFILCYDENDGYFDHVPPFVPPDPKKKNSGLASKDIDLYTEHLTLAQDLERKPAAEARGSSLGLGYRVPLVIASPWSRGGAVCSQVFDHTSVLQFLEVFLSHKTGNKIEESNVSTWRRTVCGDLSSVFKPYSGEKITLPQFLSRDAFVESIHKAQFKQNPSGYRPLSMEEVDLANHTPTSLLPRQEKGTRTARPLPYQLYADGKFINDNQAFEIRLEAKTEFFGTHSAGSAFHVYGPGKAFRVRNYAVKAGDALTDSWAANAFDDGNYHLKVSGPNGFLREFKGSVSDPTVQIKCDYERNAKHQPTGNVELTLVNSGKQPITTEVHDNAYKQAVQTKKIPVGNTKININLTKSSGWYDFSIRLAGNSNFECRFAGRVETGKEGSTDPAMSGFQ